MKAKTSGALGRAVCAYYLVLGLLLLTGLGAPATCWQAKLTSCSQLWPNPRIGIGQGATCTACIQSGGAFTCPAGTGPTGLFGSGKNYYWTVLGNSFQDRMATTGTGQGAFSTATPSGTVNCLVQNICDSCLPSGGGGRACVHTDANPTAPADPHFSFSFDGVCIKP